MIQNGKTVKLQYVLMVDGEIVDSSEKSGIFEYTHGKGQIINGLERALEGLKPGDTKKIHVGPDDAYGPINPNAVMEIPRDQIQEGELQIGMVLTGKSAEGKTLKGLITQINDDTVAINFNHPLAGKELYFEIEVVDVQ